MAAAGKSLRQEAEQVDLSALKLMLAYVEAECRRLGAPDIAAHVAQAASMFPIRSSNLMDQAVGTPQVH